MTKVIQCKRCGITATVNKKSLCARLRLCLEHANDYAKREFKDDNS